MDKSLINFDKICRLCLQNLDNGSLVSLFTMNFSIRPLDMILRCASIEIYEKDGLPPSICNDCFYKLGMAYEFRNRCEASDLKLREFLIIDPKENDIPQIHDSSEPVKDDEIYAAMNEIFGSNEHPSISNQIPIFQVSSILDDLDGEKISKKSKNVKKVKPIKKKAKLDELLEKHKERLKEENSKVKIFKQRRISKKNAQYKDMTLLKEPEHCLTCGKIFKYSGYLESHMRTHSGVKPFECNICKRKFAQSGNLSLHLRTHTGERKYQCEICSKFFTTSSNLQAHIRIHSDRRNFKCLQCPLTFKTSTSLANHTGTHSGVKNQICKICSKAFYKISYLNTHMKTVHIGMKRHRCSECDKVFSNSSNLICHKRIHSGDRPFQCKVCSAKFTQSSALMRHGKQHNKVKKSAKSIVEDAAKILESIPEPQISHIIDNPSSYAYDLPHITDNLSVIQPISGDLLNLQPLNHPQQIQLSGYDMNYAMTGILGSNLNGGQPTYIFDA